MVDMRVHLAVAALATAIGWVSMGASARPMPNDPTRLVVYGHSMPAGGGASNPDRGYAPTAAGLLGLPVVNYASGGATAQDVLAATEKHPTPTREDLVILHVGLNDLLLHGSAPADAARVLVDRLTSDGARLMLVQECQPATWLHEAPYDRGTEAAYLTWNEALAEIADEFPAHVTLVDACATWEPETMTDAGGYHPSDKGHALIAQALSSTVSP